MSKVIITVVGKDTRRNHRKGMYPIWQEKQVNILDISQTIVQDYFNMMMIADMEHATGSFDEVATELEKGWRGDRRSHWAPARGNLHQDAPHLIKKTEGKRIQPC